MGMPVRAYMRRRCAGSTREAAQASARPSFHVIAGAKGEASPRQTKVGS